MEEARAAAPGTSPWQPAGVRRLPESRFREEKRGEAGRSWSRWGVPFVEEPKVAAPLDCRVAAGLQAKLLDGGTLVQGLQSRSRPSRPFTEPNRLLPLHRAVRRLAGTPRRGAAAQGRRRFGSHGPRRPTSSAPGRSAALHRAFFAVMSRTRGEKPPSPCCGPGHRAEAGPSHVSSLFVCCLLSRIAPPRRPAVA
jgi:hypothetical protein